MMLAACAYEAGSVAAARSEEPETLEPGVWRMSDELIPSVDASDSEGVRLSCCSAAVLDSFE
jgi:hypothetical protein